MLSFFRNGTLLQDHAVQRIRGLVYPAASGTCGSKFASQAACECLFWRLVADGAVLEANFTQSFTHPAPSGYSGIIVATDMI